MRKKYFVHEKALVETKGIGINTRIWAFTHIMNKVKVGDNCNIGEHCFIETGVTIGNNVTIKNGISLWNGIIIEDNVFLGPNAVLTNDLRPRSKFHDYKILKTIIKRGTTIGANATIICGLTLGEYSFVGAGSVVTRSVSDFTLVYGNPARIRGYVCECGQKLIFCEDIALCACGKEYKYVNNQVDKIVKEI